MPKVAVVGAGVAGLSAAIALAQQGASVEVVEALDAPGGKMRVCEVGGAAVNAGPTVLTMKWVFDELLAPAGRRIEDLVQLQQAGVLARHFWADGSRLDLHADITASADAISDFADAANAEGYLRFCRDSAAIFELVREPLIRAQRPSLAGFSMAMLRRGPAAAFGLDPFTTLWTALGRYFGDPRLRQLFARYATYVGSSPFRAPATLMLVAHVEQAGVWMVEGGMHGLARALASHAGNHGVRFRYGCAATALRQGGRRRHRLELETGEALDVDAVIFNGDVSALASLLPPGSNAGAEPVPLRERSLSAMTWCARMDMAGAHLAHHNVFFSDNYRGEFEALAAGRAPLADPTVYVCAQDRTDRGELPAGTAGERLFILVNAPADGDGVRNWSAEEETCRTNLTKRLETNGVRLRWEGNPTRFAGPTEFARMFPGTGGALYGRASHGSLSTFRRPGARTRIAGLYLAGGSVHPGPGVPMAAMSGRLAAASLMQDAGLSEPSVSMLRSKREVIGGGMSTA